MSVIDHNIHTDGIIVDADKHFTISTINRAITPDPEYKKLTIMQYDNKSERYSFDIDRKIDGHDLMNCNRVQIHFINIGSNKQKHPGLYRVDDVHVNKNDEDKITFTWLISQDATQLSGVLSFLVSFECVEGDTVLYRWSSSVYNQIQITAGMDNGNAIMELYADELLAWQVEMERNHIPVLVDLCYVNREFATSEEVAAIFSGVAGVDPLVGYVENATVDSGVLTITKSDGTIVEFTGGGSDMSVDSVLSENSTNPVQNKAIAEAINETKSYTDVAIATAMGTVDDAIAIAITNAITQTLGGSY